jgi:hypothetical protein
MVFTDTAGNTFLGDAIYSDGTQKLTGHPFPSIATELNAFLTASGLKFRNVPTQADFDALSAWWLTFGVGSDSLDDRFLFQNIGNNNSQSTTNINSGAQVGVYNDLGFLGTDPAINAPSASGQVWAAINANTTIPTGVSPNTSATKASLMNHLPYAPLSDYLAVSDGESLAMIHFVYPLGDTKMGLRFWYAGRLADVNPNYAYYNSSIETDTIVMTNNPAQVNGNFTSVATTITTPIGAGHRIAGARNQILATGKAIYPIVCAGPNPQTPTSQWATDMYVFDDNPAIGSPCIGRVRNLLLAQGTFTIGRVVKIQGTVVPDNGSRLWVAIGTFAEKTVLMRCFSSVDF